MGYVIAGILVLLLVTAFVTFLVMNSMRKGAGAGTADPSARQSGRGGPPGIGEDPTPLGDTSEHSGTQTEEGRTLDAAEGGEHGYDPAAPAPAEGAHDEGRPVPDSERLADRPR